MKLQNSALDKRRFVFLTFCVFCVFCAGKSFAQDFKTLQDGIEHAEIKRGTETEPIKINLLRLDLTKVRLDVVHALDQAIGLETVSSMATRHDAFAAINAGFFRLDKSIFAGDAVGILQVDGKLLSESYGNRIALGIVNGKRKTETLFSHLSSDNYLVEGTDETFKISGINRERKENEIVLFTPEFNQTTLTNNDGFELVIKDRVVKEINFNKGNSPIPPYGFVISISNIKFQKHSRKRSIVRLITKVVTTELEKQNFFAKTEDIVSGVPQLVKNGAIEITWEQEKSSKSFVETRHPRTAVAKLKDGKFLMITVNGRQKESVGMNLNELAALLVELGATDAMNLDGGGSTTMFLNGKIVNKPSDKEGERKVSDAILVFPRKKI
jgi:exopolysaccharide biosynthesis protein